MVIQAPLRLVIHSKVLVPAMVKLETNSEAPTFNLVTHSVWLSGPHSNTTLREHGLVA
jgi:hypothetical protein